jgi:hypothetical protein
MDTIVDRFVVPYAIWRVPLCEGAIIYHVFAGNELVARPYVRVDLGSVREVLVYCKADRRRGIASALYDLVEADIGRPLVPSRIRSKDGRAFWARRLAVLQAH